MFSKNDKKIYVPIFVCRATYEDTLDFLLDEQDGWFIYDLTFHPELESTIFPLDFCSGKTH